MKTVYTNDMVAHVFTTQSQPEGRSGNGQFYFEGPHLFSYGRHYVAAFYLHALDGSRVGLVNADSNSVTTNRHVSRARYAMPGRAIPCAGLTDWADFLHAATTSYDWGKAEAGEAAGTRPAWLPSGRNLKTAAERKADLPRLKQHLANPSGRLPFPGEEAAAAMLAALGQREPAKAAARAARAERARIAAEEAEKAKEQRDRTARAAKIDAMRTPAELRRKVTGHLANAFQSSRGIDDLKSLSANLLRETQEAKARGWTRIAANLKGQRATVREGIASGEKRAGAAWRNRNKARSIERFRDVSKLIQGHLDKVAAGAAVNTTGSPEGLARGYQELAAAAADLSRHVTLPESTLARLTTLQDGARKAAALWQETARAAAYREEEEARADWLDGGRGESNGSRRLRLSDKRGGALIRAEDVTRDESGMIDGGTLATSHGARVPLVHALRAFRFLKLCHDTGRAWRANGKTLRVGHFRVDSVEPSGDFVAGCHRINWEEVARLAASLDVLDLAPEDTTHDSASAA